MKYVGYIVSGVFLLCFVLIAKNIPKVYSQNQSVISYPLYPGALSDAKVTGTANNTPLQFIYHKVKKRFKKSELEVNYARFAVNGPTDIALDIQGDLSGISLKGVGITIPITVNGTHVTAKIPGPGRYYMSVPGLYSAGLRTYTVLLLADSITEYQQMLGKFSQATNITTRGIVSNPTLDQTNAIQSLLNSPGTYYFPAGIYRSKPLSITSSNITLYFDPGAVLLGTDDYVDSCPGAFLNGADNITGLKIDGYGVIDTNGVVNDRSDGCNNGIRVHMINLSGSENIELNNIVFQNSNSYSIHLRHSKNVTINKAVVFSGKDGIDPDSSQDVLVDGSVVFAVDDAFAVKNNYPTKSSTERITMRNNIVSSVASALKIGTETQGPVRNITWENSEVVDSDRGIVIYAFDGGPIENISWKNIRLNMHDWTEEDESGTSFLFEITDRNGISQVKGIRIENIETNSIYRSLFEGLSNSKFDDIILKNITLLVSPPKEGKPYLFEANENVHGQIDGLTVNWRGNKNLWSGILNRPSAFIITGLTEYADIGPTSTPPATIPTATPPLTLTPTLPANGTPTTSPTSCEDKKRTGDFACDGGVSEADFTAWKNSYSGKATTLSYFEYWRRNTLP